MYNHSIITTKIQLIFFVLTGYLDDIEARDFGMWLQTEGDQEISGSQMIDNLEVEDLAVDMINSIDLGRMAEEGVFLTDNVTLSHVVFGELNTLANSNVRILLNN